MVLQKLSGSMKDSEEQARIRQFLLESHPLAEVSSVLGSDVEIRFDATHSRYRYGAGSS